MPEVIFYRTTREGQEEIARLAFVQGRRIVSGNDEVINDLLGNKITDSDILGAMREAPARFNGSYLRAEFVP